jgi:hypothetical protein
MSRAYSLEHLIRSPGSTECHLREIAHHRCKNCYMQFTHVKVRPSERHSDNKASSCWFWKRKLQPSMSIAYLCYSHHTLHENLSQITHFLKKKKLHSAPWQIPRTFINSEKLSRQKPISHLGTPLPLQLRLQFGSSAALVADAPERPLRRRSHITAQPRSPHPLQQYKSPTNWEGQISSVANKIWS